MFWLLMEHLPPSYSFFHPSAIAMHRTRHKSPPPLAPMTHSTRRRLQEGNQWRNPSSR